VFVCVRAPRDFFDKNKVAKGAVERWPDGGIVVPPARGASRAYFIII